VAEICQCGLGMPGSQHGGAAGQDRVQPDGLGVTGKYQRVGDQAAYPQCGGNAGREEAAAGVAAGRWP
jgi:hypothetical protein